MPSEIAHTCGADVEWKGAAFAATGEYYLLGWYGSTVDLDPSEGTDIRTPASFVGENFLSKFDANGKYLWSRLLPGPGELRPRVLTMTASGELAFAGVTNTGKCLGMLSAEGELRWLRTFPAILGVEMSEGGMTALTTDVSGNLYVGGNFEGELDLDPGPGTLTLVSDRLTGFVASFTPAGELRWGRALSEGGNCESYVSALALRDNQLVSVGSVHRGTCLFAAGGAHEAALVTGASGAVFIERADLDGHAEQALFLNSTGLTGSDTIYTRAESVVVAADGIYIGGVFNGQVDFDPGPGSSLRGSAGIQTFVVKLTSNGALAWLRSIQGGTRLMLAPGSGVLAVGVSRETIVPQGAAGGSIPGSLTLTALNENGSAAWTVDANAGGALGASASNSDQILIAGDFAEDCSSPIRRFAWPR